MNEVQQAGNGVFVQFHAAFVGHHVSDDLERLVMLYEAWGKPDKAAERRKKCPKSKSAS